MDAIWIYAIQFLSACVSFGLVIYSFRYQSTREVRFFQGIFLIAGLWSALYGLELVAPSLSEKVLFMQVRFIFLPFLEVFVLLFALEHFGGAHLTSKRRWLPLTIIPIITAFLAVTSNYQDLFRYDYQLQDLGYIVTLGFTNGPWTLVHEGYSFLLVFLSLIVAIASIRRSHSLYARQAAIFSISIIIPAIFDLVYILEIMPITGYNLASAMFSISGLIIIVGIFRLQYMDIRPVGRGMVMEQLTDPILIMDEKNQLVDLNRAASNIFEWGTEPPLGRALAEVIPELKTIIGQTNGSGQRQELAMTIKGNRQVFEVTKTDVNIKGTFREKIVIMRDITIRRAALDAVELSEKKYRELMDAAPFPIIITSVADDHVLYINQRAEQLFKVSREKALGERVQDYYVNIEDRKKVVDPLRSKGFVHDQEVEFRTADAKKLWAYVSGIIIDFEGKRAFFAAFNDISERKRMEEAMRITNKKQMLLSSITRHDMLNQLVAFQGFLHLAEEEKDANKVVQYLHKLDSNLRTMQAIVEFTKDYQSLGISEPGWYDVEILLHNAIMKRDIGKIQIVGDLKGVKIFGDALLEKVFYNLLDNSVRHGGRVSKIEVSSDVEEGKLIIVFKDDGGGILDEDKERIFQQGFGKNTGFGLFLCREILAITGSRIVENGTYGNGARFEITVSSGNFKMDN